MKHGLAFLFGSTFRFSGADVVATGLKKDSSLVT
jgi:hypothetical protein